MDRPFECPECHCRHDEPAHATYGMSVRCLDCELAYLYHADRRSVYEEIARAA